jgi:hypothetical protein
METASKADIVDLRSELLGVKDELRSEFLRVTDQLRARMEDQESRLEERLERLQESIRVSQTEVLKAVYGFTQSIQSRLEGSDQTEASLKRRMASIEGRVLEIEKRLNLPPAA